MNKRVAVRMFKEEVMPYIRTQYEQDRVPDWPARREGWNNFTDSLCKDGEITSRQYENWTHPSICGQ